MGNSQSKTIFLLGGYDLEMVTIKQLLEKRDDCIVADKHLTWNNAFLSAYREELTKYADSKIYGIELRDDITAPDNYTLIDHHNDKSGKPSSLEQVATMLGVSMDRYLQLVSANDKGYIPAVKAMKASKVEIEDIRRKDRAAQGVTKEDEAKAKLALESADISYPGLVFVKTTSSKFSPIIDSLSEAYPYHSYIVYTDDQICTYGPITPLFIRDFQDKKELYYGGTGNGYAGLSDIRETSMSMEQIIQTIKTMKPISKHIFLFPFKYDKSESLDDVNFWKRAYIQKGEKDKKDLFNEKQYFYPFVHDALYDRGDNGAETALIRHYECQKKDGKYIVVVNQKEYVLDIESINVNLYDFGLGILAIHLLNTDTKQGSPDDILKINQYGRRVMPPFYNDMSNRPRIELADKIKLTWENEDFVEEVFDPKIFTTEKDWHVGSVISNLLNPYNIKHLTVEPAIDDRMFTLCYYENNEEMARIANNSPHSSNFSRELLNKGASCQDFWYKYVFVDGGDTATCYGNHLYSELLNKQTYSRWEHPLWGTEYGVSKYSLVALTTETAPSFLLNYFETIYTRLAELVLCQRAALVIFSKRVRELAKEGNIDSHLKESAVLSNEYVRFVNSFCYREVTAQDQGIELYSLMKQTLNTDSYEQTLREQISQLHDKIMEIHNERNERNSLWLNKLASIVIPITVLASLAGLGQLLKGGFDECEVLAIFIGVIIVGSIGAILIYWKTNSINKSK